VPRSSTLTRAAAGIGAAGAACVAYGTVVERRWYRLRHLHLPGALRPGAERPVRLLHVSDVHLDPPQRHRVAFLAEIAREPVDLVVLTGDLLGGERAEDAVVDALAPLTADGTPGVLVLGSNDLFGPTFKSPTRYFVDPDHRQYGARLDTERMLDGLARHRIRTLRNETTTVQTAAGPVVVGGIDDPHLHDTVLPDASALRSTDGDAVLHLGLVHAPYTAALDLLADTGHDLLMSGHTHGGQVRFPPVGAVVANCDLPLDQVRGASRYRDRWLHVSPGLGHSRYAPFRFACRPEATVLTLLP
jgi:predicted MPP superfamily phosphohydrolase